MFLFTFFSLSSFCVLSFILLLFMFSDITNELLFLTFYSPHLLLISPMIHISKIIIKSSGSQIFFKIGVLKNFANFTEKYLRLNLFLISFFISFKASALCQAKCDKKRKKWRKISALPKIRSWKQDSSKYFENYKLRKNMYWRALIGSYPHHFINRLRQIVVGRSCHPNWQVCW